MDEQLNAWNEEEKRRAKYLTLPNQLLADLTLKEHARLHAATFKFRSVVIPWNKTTHPKIVTALDWTVEEMRRYYGHFIFMSYVGGNDITGTCPKHIHALMKIPFSTSIPEFCDHLRKLWCSKLRKSLNLSRQEVKSTVWVSPGAVANTLAYLDYLSREEECEVKEPTSSTFSPTDKLIIGRSFAL